MQVGSYKKLVPLTGIMNEKRCWRLLANRQEMLRSKVTDDDGRLVLPEANS